MKKTLIFLIATILAALSARAEITADWKLHMPFDRWPTSIIETPGRVYFLSRTFEHNGAIPARAINSNSLFYYDKAGEEVVSFNRRNLGSGNAVACMAYNAEKGYLLVVYTDCNIDFVYDDGRILNILSLNAASIQGRKEVNSITFDNENDRVYLATSFGYVSLNDRKYEVAESRIYNEDIQSVARCGSNIVLCHDYDIYYAPASDQRYNFSSYKLMEDSPSVDVLLPLKGNDFVAYTTAVGGTIYKVVYTGGGYKAESLADDPKVHCMQTIKGGYRLCGNVVVYTLTDGGELTYETRTRDAWRIPSTTLDGKELWVLFEKKGVRGYRLPDNSIAHHYTRPNAPATYISSDIAHHPKYGMLAGSNGYDFALAAFGQATPGNLSALKWGIWQEYGPDYVAPDKFPSTTNYFGVAIDPKNTDYVYRSNVLGGLMRLNLSNPDDILILANPSNENAGSQGFIKVADDLAAWSRLCRFSTPRFTSDGTMWTLYNNADTELAELWWWTAADRAATTSASTYRPMNRLQLPRFPSNNTDVMVALDRNPGMVVMGGLGNGGSLMLYDHRNTPATKGDDRYVFYDSPYDQDGGGVTFLNINNLMEDPQTGLVWIMSQRGIFTINPATAFDTPNLVSRIKVSRNDGTNLADYLLNEINVNNMAIDGEGRKWFCTSNGLVCTSADGRTILGEFTTDNSYLPADNVLAACYNPDNNSMLVATDGGLVEMFPSGSGSSELPRGDAFRVYPNPVEPNYYGWVRIDNIADGSLVKITDASGGIVKELGPAEGGSVEWDVSGHNNRRVSTGVYYVMVSPGNAGNGETKIQKILVLN